LLPKIVEYGLAAEEEVRYTIEHDLRDELLAAKGLVPCHVAVNGPPAQTARSTQVAPDTAGRLDRTTRFSRQTLNSPE
jgi:hypothetical protein